MSDVDQQRRFQSRLRYFGIFALVSAPVTIPVGVAWTAVSFALNQKPAALAAASAAGLALTAIATRDAFPRQTYLLAIPAAAILCLPLTRVLFARERIGERVAVAIGAASAAGVASVALTTPGMPRASVAAALVLPSLVAVSAARLWNRSSFRRLADAELAILEACHPAGSALPAPGAGAGAGSLLSAAARTVPRQRPFRLPRGARPLYDGAPVEGSWFRRYVCQGIATVDVPCVRDAGTDTRPANRPVLVMVHGYAAGNALWTSVLHRLAQDFHVYALDWRGCGLSDRPDFTWSSTEEAEAWFSEPLERWRQAVGLTEPFVLVGHSMGAITTTNYAVAHPSAVRHLVLASPAAVNDPPADLHTKPVPGALRAIRKLWSWGLTPMSLTRWLGPLGPGLVQRVVGFRLGWMQDPEHVADWGAEGPARVAEYMYHNWALEKSGERAITALLHPGVHAKSPLRHKISPSATPMPISFMYGGGGDWMDVGHAKIVQREQAAKGKRDITVDVVPNAGHQLFLQNPEAFVEILGRRVAAAAAK